MNDDSLLLPAELATLAEGLANGDLAALGRLFDRTAGRLFRYAMALTRNRDDAEDALQATMVRVAQHPRKLAGARLPWAYLLRIVRNEALQIVQRRRPMQSLSVEFDGWSEDHARLDREESAARVRLAVQKLPPEQAEVVLLKQWEEMTFAEIADVTGESPNTVASRYRYALEKLSRSLEALLDEVCHER